MNCSCSAVRVTVMAEINVNLIAPSSAAIWTERGSVTRSRFAKQKTFAPNGHVMNGRTCCGSQSRAPQLRSQPITVGLAAAVPANQGGGAGAGKKKFQYQRFSP